MRFFIMIAMSLITASLFADLKDEPRFRFINGKRYDLSEPIAWAQDKISGVKYSGGTTFLTEDGVIPKYVSSEVAILMKKHSEGAKKWKEYLVLGKVLQITKDGVLVQLGEYGETIKLIKNHPQQKTLVDGDKIECVAMPVGNYSYKTTTGSNSTVKSYDYGIPDKNQF